MLELKKISKSYTTGDFTQVALNEVSVAFRKNEFVAVLGPSGSGKTTLLNIIGGLDRYDSGDLIINGTSTKDFKDRDWDAYRNNCIGFVFQSYNLIGHISVLKNVEMCMTLSGVSANERKNRALEALDKVGIKEHAHKKPNQLSGGQMQRVAIARALVNDPDVILADEPTGALDSTTSKQIMELIQSIAKNKLVIMVTHNAELACEYANRVVDFKDGFLVADSNKVKGEKENKEGFNIKKTAMSFLTALNLSFNNIKTKKGRTILTSFASSIGIIGIALILSLSNGFDIQIKNFERDSLSSMPIMVMQQAMEISQETMRSMNGSDEPTYIDDEIVIPEVPLREQVTHSNVLTKDYVEYIKNIDEKLIGGMSLTGSTNLNIITRQNGVVKPLGLDRTSFVTIPSKQSEEGKYDALEDSFDLIYGNLPKSATELLLVIDSRNKISSEIIDALGLDSTNKEISFEDILNAELKLILNNEYYRNLGSIYTINSDYEILYNNENAIKLTISGIIRGKEDKRLLTSNQSGLTYTNDLVELVISKNKDSNIVKAQRDASYNIMSGQPFSNEEGSGSKDQILGFLGDESIPAYIEIYPLDFDSKDKILEYLDAWNEGKETEEKILYTDMGKMISSLSGNIMGAVTTVLIAFSAISLIVSSIMIGIITYISVLERTKEIGVLRALGARKKDITRVFNAETFIIGVASGAIGIGITCLLLIPANKILYNLTELKNVAVLNPLHALILIVISIVLTLIGGFIPAKIASRKDPVIALRTE